LFVIGVKQFLFTYCHQFAPIS